MDKALEPALRAPPVDLGEDGIGARADSDSLNLVLHPEVPSVVAVSLVFSDRVQVRSHEDEVELVPVARDHRLCYVCEVDLGTVDAAPDLRDDNVVPVLAERGHSALDIHVPAYSFGGEARKVPGGTRQQVHDLDGAIARDVEPPFAGSFAERTLKTVSFARLELLRGKVARGAGQDGERCRAGRGRTGVVGAEDVYPNRFFAGVDEAKDAHLVVVPPRVEGVDPVQAPSEPWHRLEAREEALVRAHVAQDPQVEPTLKLEPPAPRVGGLSDAFDPFCGVPPLNVCRVEVYCLASVDPERNRPVPGSIVLEGRDGDLAPLEGEVFDADEAVSPAHSRCRLEKRHVVEVPDFSLLRARSSGPAEHDRCGCQ